MAALRQTKDSPQQIPGRENSGNNSSSISYCSGFGPGNEKEPGSYVHKYSPGNSQNHRNLVTQTLEHQPSVGLKTVLLTNPIPKLASLMDAVLMKSIIALSSRLSIASAMQDIVYA